MYYHYLMMLINAVEPYVVERAGRYYLIEGLVVDNYTWTVVEMVGS